MGRGNRPHSDRAISVMGCCCKNLLMAICLIGVTASFGWSAAGEKYDRDQLSPVPPRPSIKTISAAPNPLSKVRISAVGESLTLNWGAVTTDSTGASEAVAYYEVFCDTVPYFTPSLSNRLATTQDTSFTHVLTGLVGDPQVNHFYAISAVDTNGNVSAPSRQVCEFDLSLPSGWSAISLPIQPAIINLDTLLGAQLTGGQNEDESDLIFAFDPVNQMFQNAWYNVSAGHWQGSLTELHPHQGYFFYIRPGHPRAVVSLLGALAYDQQSLQIYEGWNLVGYPFAQDVKLDNSGLLDSGLQGGESPWTSDRLYQFMDQSFRSAWLYANDLIWFGEWDSFEVTKGYWLLRLSGRGEFQWNCGR